MIIYYYLLIMIGFLEETMFICCIKLVNVIHISIGEFSLVGTFFFISLVMTRA